jgi:hypothetical protein
MYIRPKTWERLGKLRIDPNFELYMLGHCTNIV